MSKQYWKKFFIQNSKDKLPIFAKWYVKILPVFLGLILADLFIISIRDNFLPTNIRKLPIPTKTIKKKPSSLSFYDNIVKKDFFHFDGEPLNMDENLTKESGKQSVPVASKLPLTLVGTIVHSDPKKSVATIEVRGENEVNAYREGEKIGNLAKLTSIERKKIFFLNLNNSQMEYIEIPEDMKIKFDLRKKSTPDFSSSESNKEVEQVSENSFRIKRDDILKYINDLPNLLQQARAVPHRDPVTGEIDGFTLIDMKPGSIFEKIGLKRMDVIKTVNGELVNSPNKAMQLFEELKSSSSIDIGVERDGAMEKINYKIF